MNVLVICEMSGRVRDAFLARGHHALSVDLLPTMRRGPHFQGSIQDFLAHDKTPWDMAICFPPCTHLALSSNGHARQDRKIAARPQAIEFVYYLSKLPIKKIAIENPKGILSTKFRPPDQIIHPYHHGHPEPKGTCLWLKNLPKLVETKNVQLEMFRTPKNQRDKILTYQGPIRLRAITRSLTYPGIAKAMAEQWGANE